MFIIDLLNLSLN